MRWKRYLQGAGVMDGRDGFAGFERCSTRDRRKLLTDMLDLGVAREVAGLNKRHLCVASTELLEGSEIANALPCFIPPLDNFLWNRKLVHDIWGLNYRWEIYTPPEKRIHGPYAMPLVTPSGVYGPIDFYVDRTDQNLYGRLSTSSLQSTTPKVKAAAEAAAGKLTRAVGARSIRWL